MQNSSRKAQQMGAAPAAAVAGRQAGRTAELEKGSRKHKLLTETVTSAKQGSSDTPAPQSEETLERERRVITVTWAKCHFASLWLATCVESIARNRE